MTSKTSSLEANKKLSMSMLKHMSIKAASTVNGPEKHTNLLWCISHCCTHPEETRSDTTVLPLPADRARHDTLTT